MRPGPVTSDSERVTRIERAVVPPGGLGCRPQTRGRPGPTRPCHGAALRAWFPPPAATAAAATAFKKCTGAAGGVAVEVWAVFSG